MVQPTEDRSRSDKIARGKLVTVRTRRNAGLGRFRNSGSQRAMRPAPIVVADEFSDDPPEVPLVDRDEIIEALPADRTDHSFAEGIGCRGSRRSFQDANAEAFQFVVNARRKDPVAVANQKSVRMVDGEKLAELPDGPIGGRVGGDVGVENPAGTDIHGNEYVENPECCRDRYKEITGDDGFGVAAHEGGPSQVVRRSARPKRGQIFPNGSRRDMHAEFERKFIGDSSLAPRWILVRHPPYQRPNVPRQRPTAWIPGLPSPKA